MGPLAGIRIIELGGIGAVPFCALLLADLGADVLRIDRIVPSDSGVDMERRFHLLNRGRRSIAMDLKHPAAVAAVKRLAVRADGLAEGFRPGVTERMGLGPDALFEVNPRLVYGRLTGWGQDGPLAQAPGHDINYIALSGVLHSIGRAGAPPTPPLNLVGDLGGGALYLAMGMLAALLEARGSGRGQVVDTSMAEGSASLMMLMYGMRAAGLWSDERAVNRLDSGYPWYDSYRTSDGKYVAFGAQEPRFYKDLLVRLGLHDLLPLDRYDPRHWPQLRERIGAVIATRTRDAWCALLDDSEACFAPVLSMGEAPRHPQFRARGSFVELEGVVQPGPQPRFSRTPASIQRGVPGVGEHTDEALADWGFGADEIADLRRSGAVA